MGVVGNQWPSAFDFRLHCYCNVHIYTHTHTHVYVYIYIYIYICIYVYMYLDAYNISTYIDKYLFQMSSTFAAEAGLLRGLPSTVGASVVVRFKAPDS